MLKMMNNLKSTKKDLLPLSFTPLPSGDTPTRALNTMLKLRSLISQLCAIFPYCCLQFILGALSGFYIILIAELYKDESEIPTSLEQLSWFASLDIFKLFGTMFTGLLMHRLGCRLVALLTALKFIGSYLLYYFSTSATIVILSRVLASMLAVNPLSGPYITEISEPRFRSSFLAIAQLADSFGTFFSLLLGSFMSWRNVALVNLVFPILTAATVLATPNSPTWLASKGRLVDAEVDAEKALCWLRGWVKPELVQVEFRAMIDSIEASAAERKLDVESVSYAQRSSKFLQLFLQRSFYLPFGTFALMLVMSNLSGITTIEDYATVIFRELNSPIEESVATAIMGAVGIVGNLIVLLIVHRTGKRRLALLSVVLVGSCQATIAIIGFLELRNGYMWIPPIAVIVASFANAWGIGAVMFMITGEIFPSSVRYVAASMSFAVKIIGLSIINKLYLYMVDAFTLPGVFLFFALMSFVGLVIYYFLFPETEGRTLQEIEDRFKGVENTKKAEM